MSITAHSPTAEANALLGDGFVARTLEPGRPADTDPEFFADDPALAGDGGGARVVTPTSGGDITWAEIVDQRPELAGWAAERWLANRPPLPPVPAGYPAARDGYHRLAYGVVAEARRLANTKFGLRFTRGGFGTPFFGDDEQVRVEHGVLVWQRGNTVDSTAITTLRAAGDFLGFEPGTTAAEHDSPPLGDPDTDLGATDATGEFLAAWFGFAWSVLEELRLTDGAVDVDRTQLWPGHFDPAIAMGDADTGGRATYGASPGDAGHAEPYLYIGAWGDVDRSDPFWNETDFNGASMSYAALRTADDPVAHALAFLRDAHHRLP
ncbi:MAG: hypothetical protein RIB98_09365 [Acidimicrobiales bacterium]